MTTHDSPRAIASWKAFAAAAPGLAAQGRHYLYLYGVGMGFLATVRRDGGPRLHPICPMLMDDALFALIVPGPKMADLRRDGRYALHALTSPPPRQDDAFYIAGTVTEVTERSTWDRVAALFLAERHMESRWTGFEDQVLFEFGIERCLLTLTTASDGLPAGHSLWRGEPADRIRSRRVPTQELTAPEIAVIRELLVDAFGSDEEERFTDEDWEHSIGGMHFLLELGGTIVAHASVVERELRVDGLPLRTGYVEAVATAPPHQGHGLGTRVMREVGSYIQDGFELGALGTGSHHFYERLGWQTWRGPSSVRTADGMQRTPDDDGYILVLPTPSSPTLDLTAPISCEWRPGDVW